MNQLSLGRLKLRKRKVCRGRVYVSRGMDRADLCEPRLRNQIFLKEYLQGRLISLPALTRRLLLRFIAGHFLIEITFTGTAGRRLCAIDTEVFGDKIPVDLVFEDQAPFAEGLYADQQDQCYRDGILYHRAQS